MTLYFGHYLLILFLMFFFHVVDDYYLQGVLAKMKQKKWWEENAPDSLYKDDYIIALFIHAFSWSFMITLPWFVIAFISLDTLLIVFLILSYFCNVIMHTLTDHMKANEHILSLVQDQSRHFYQIIITWVILTLAYII